MSHCVTLTESDLCHKMSDTSKQERSSDIWGQLRSHGRSWKTWKLWKNMEKPKYAQARSWQFMAMAMAPWHHGPAQVGWVSYGELISVVSSKHSKLIYSSSVVMSQVASILGQKPTEMLRCNFCNVWTIQREVLPEIETLVSPKSEVNKGRTCSNRSMFSCIKGDILNY